MTKLNNEDRAQLRDFLADRFSLSEMKDLCFDLGVDYEEFPHATTPEFSRELILYFERQNKIGCLIAEMIQVRPDSWLTQLLAQVPGCDPNQKVQVVLSNDQIKSRPDFKKKLADLLGIGTDEVMIIATAVGSIKLLLGLPPAAAERLADLSLPRRMESYELVSVTPFPRLPAPAQSAWRAGWKTAVASGSGSAASGTSAAGGLSTVVKVIIGVLIVGVLLVGVGLVVWRGSQPQMTVINRCPDPLPIPAPAAIKSALSLPDEIPPGERISVPILTGSGRYELFVTRGGVMALRLPRPIPGLGLNEVELGEIERNTAVTLNGRLVDPPQRFNIESGAEYELVICAPGR